MVLNQADNIYLGGIAQDKVYLGDTLIWHIPVVGNKIYYTSADGEIIRPLYETGWTANIVSNTYVDGQGCIEFDGDITAIRESAFFMADNLLSIIIPETITSIERSAFDYCHNLISITIPSGVTSIGDAAFSFCQALASITIPSGVTNIDMSAFYRCTSLTSITIPSSVTYIGEEAFYGCTGLTEIHMEGTTPPTLQNASINSTFDNTNNCPIYVPASAVNTYKTATGWSEYADRIQAKP